MGTISSILGAIAGGFRAVASFFGYEAQRDAEKNTSTMQANAQARTDAASADRAAADVQAAQGGDLEQLRKDAAE